MRAIEKYTDDITARLKETGAGKVFSLGTIRLYECPVSYLSGDTREIIRLVYLLEDTGNMLHAGGWAEQPFWLIQAFEIFKRETARVLKEKRVENGK